jgi:peptide/nickel transport system substrate-binding protein
LEAKQMQRRTLLIGGCAVSLAAPGIVRAETARVLRFIPNADLPSLDPVSTTSLTTLLHGNTIYDQLFGLDAGFQPQPQMLAGHRADADNTLWELNLREGLLFHDDSPVLARDCVASILRWARRDPYGSALLARAEEITAASDKRIRIRLKRPFTLLPQALAQPTCLMMPEHVAMTDPFKQIIEPTGSGPFRFLADERIPGYRVAYARFEKYVPRSEGTASFLAGPRIAHFDRVIWTYVPDASTAAAALATGEYDWWGDSDVDHYDWLRRQPGLQLELKNRMGYIGSLRFNHLHKPFSDVTVRRLVLACVNQEAFMEAVAGPQPDLYETKVGLFAPGTPMANQAGIKALRARSDFDAVKKELGDAGYHGERVVFVAPTVPAFHAQGQVAADLLQRMGFVVDSGPGRDVATPQ